MTKKEFGTWADVGTPYTCPAESPSLTQQVIVRPTAAPVATTTAQPLFDDDVVEPAVTDGKKRYIVSFRIYSDLHLNISISILIK